MEYNEIKEAIFEAFKAVNEGEELKAFIMSELFKAVNDDRWITIHPHGEDSDDYRRLKIKDGETVEEAMHRQGYYNKRKAKDEKELKDEKKKLYQEILQAKKDGNKELHHKLLQRYNEVEALLKGQKPEKKETPKSEDAQIKEKMNALMEEDKKNAKNPNFYDGFKIVVQDGVVKVEKNGIISKTGFKFDKDEIDWNSGALGNLINKWNTENPEKKEKKKPENNRKLAGVSKGEPMNREKADNKSPNPGFWGRPGCSSNCQTCVVAFEARLRGYNVQALGNYKNPTIKDLSHRTNIAWIDPETGKHPEYKYDAAVKNAKSCYQWLDKEIKPGNRYTIEFGWKGRRQTGHIVSIDKDENNALRIYDPQSGRIITDNNELLKYFQRFKYQMSTYGIKIPDPPKILRVDNMDFNFDVVDKILEKHN